MIRENKFWMGWPNFMPSDPTGHLRELMIMTLRQQGLLSKLIHNRIDPRKNPPKQI